MWWIVGGVFYLLFGAAFLIVKNGYIPDGEWLSQEELESYGFVPVAVTGDNVTFQRNPRPTRNEGDRE